MGLLRGKVEPLDESAWDKIKQCAANANEEASKDYSEQSYISMLNEALTLLRHEIAVLLVG